MWFSSSSASPSCVQVLCVPPVSSPSWVWVCCSWGGSAWQPVSFTGADTMSSSVQGSSLYLQVSHHCVFPCLWKWVSPLQMEGKATTGSSTEHRSLPPPAFCLFEQNTLVLPTVQRSQDFLGSNFNTWPFVPGHIFSHFMLYIFGSFCSMSRFYQKVKGLSMFKFEHFFKRSSAFEVINDCLMSVQCKNPSTCVVLSLWLFKLKRCAFQTFMVLTSPMCV